LVDNRSYLCYSIRVGQQEGNDMFEMFTDAGNDAVGEIVRWGILASEDRDTAYTKIHAELELLGQVGVFGEATDTAVREAVWAEICSSLPEWVFKSRRA
jgi:hypothetical protein